MKIKRQSVVMSKYISTFFFIPIFLEDGRRRGVGNRVLLAPPVGSHFGKLEIVTRLVVSVVY